MAFSASDFKASISYKHFELIKCVMCALFAGDLSEYASESLLVPS